MWQPNRRGTPRYGMVFAMMVAAGLAVGCTGQAAVAPQPPPTPVVTALPAVDAAPAPEPPPAPTWTPLMVRVGSGGLTAVGRGSELILIDQSGAVSLKQDLGSPIRAFFWSSRGDQVIAETEANRLWLAGANGEAEPLDLDLPPGPLTVAWSPDESRLLLGRDWVTDARQGYCPVWLYSLQDGTTRELGSHERLMGLYWQDEGHALVQIYTGMGTFGFERHQVDTWEKIPGGGERGTLSPDRRTLVADPRVGARLTVVDLVTGASNTVWQDHPPGAATLVPGEEYWLSAVAFAPDSSRFAYAVHRGRYQAGLGLLRVAGRDGGDEAVTDRLAGWAAWSPAGELVYAVRTDQGIDLMLGRRKLGSVPGGQQLAVNSGLAMPGTLPWSSDRNRVAAIVGHEQGSVQMAVAQVEPARVWEVPDSASLTPLMWVGTKLLALEKPFVKDDKGTRVLPKAIWLVDPETGAQTPVL
jgi:hypothetical protein